MKTTFATIKNEAGIHCRPTAVIIKTAAEYDGTITVNGEHGSATLESALELMMLALSHGDSVSIDVEGPDEEAVAQQFKELFEFLFDFPPQG